MVTMELLILLSLLRMIAGGRILAYIPTPSYSHQVVFRPLWQELSLRGHDVTVLTTDPMKNTSLTNLTEIDLSSSYGVIRKRRSHVVSSNSFTSMLFLLDLLNDVIELQMQHPFLQNLITNQSVKFDVFLLEMLIAPPIALGKRFECPIIGLTTLRQSFETVNHLVGVPTHPILYPDVLLPFDEPENLLERVISAIYALTVHLTTVFYIHPQQNLAIERYFGKGFGTVEQLTSNASLMFVNANLFLERPRPTMPATIQIGGIHIVPPKPLPQNLKIVLDSASVGVIYFSLGTNVKSEHLPKRAKDIFLGVFSELPYTILWKLDGHLPNSSDNVIISKWFPQPSILQHPNTKLFITQGGLQSMDEALYAGVPMVGIPFFGDQSGNVNIMVRRGFGLSIDIGSLEREHFKETVLEVINNPKYGVNVREASRLAYDQPMSGLERAVCVTMKLAVIVLVCVSSVLGATIDCNKNTSKNFAYDCGGHGEPHYYLNEDGVCHYTCLDNGVKKTCPHTHPAKFLEPYIRSACRHLVFECDYGEPSLTETDDFCDFGCLNGDEMHTCEEAYPLL